MSVFSEMAVAIFLLFHWRMLLTVFLLIYHVVKTFAQLLPLWEYFLSKLWKWLTVNSAATGHSAGSYSSNDTRLCLTGLVFRQIQTLGALPWKCLDHKERVSICWQARHSGKSIWMTERYASKVDMLKINESPQKE